MARLKTRQSKSLPAVGEFRLPRGDESVPSLIKWTGSKRSQALRIAAVIPPHRRYFEPFVGGGAMLYLAGHPGAVAGDVYEPLIGLWRLLQASPAEVVSNYRRQWKRL